MNPLFTAEMRRVRPPPETVLDRTVTEDVRERERGRDLLPRWGNLSGLSPERPAVPRGTEQESSVSRSRRLVLSAAALGFALAASGCSYFSPVQTHEFYQSADGNNANIEQAGALYAGVRNALIVADDDGGNPAFSATVVNYSDETVTVELEGVADGTTLFATSVSVDPGESVELGRAEGMQQVPISEIPTTPGHLIDLEVTAAGETTTITVPVVPNSLDHYGPAEKSA